MTCWLWHILCYNYSVTCLLCGTYCVIITLWHTYTLCHIYSICHTVSHLLCVTLITLTLCIIFTMCHIFCYNYSVCVCLCVYMCQWVTYSRNVSLSTEKSQTSPEIPAIFCARSNLCLHSLRRGSFGRSPVLRIACKMKVFQYEKSIITRR